MRAGVFCTMNKVAGPRTVGVEVIESIPATASYRAVQASLSSRQLNTAESAQEQDTLRFDVGELLGDINAGRASQRKQNGRRAVFSDGRNLLVPMGNNVAKSGVAIVP